MVKEFYAVRDAVSGVFNNPYNMHNEATAKRSFREACNTVEEIKYHAEDMELWFIGTYNTETGCFLGDPKLIEKGVKNND